MIWSTKVLLYPPFDWLYVYQIFVKLKLNHSSWLAEYWSWNHNLAETVHMNFFIISHYFSLQLAHWRPADSPKSREGREGTLPVPTKNPTLCSWKSKIKTHHLSVSILQCGAGWRCTPEADVSLGTLWWRFGGSCRGRPTTSSSRPACRWGDAAAAVPTRPWSVCPRSRTRSPWRYPHRQTHTVNP